MSYLDAQTRRRFKFLTNNFTLPALTIAADRDLERPLGPRTLLRVRHRAFPARMGTREAVLVDRLMANPPAGIDVATSHGRRTLTKRAGVAPGLFGAFPFPVRDSSPSS